jgi:predicted nucleic acid-binding protein
MDGMVIHTWTLVERFDRNIAEHNRIMVAGEAKIAAFAVLAGMSLVRHEFGDSADLLIGATAGSFKLTLASKDRKIRHSRLVSTWKP